MGIKLRTILASLGAVTLGVAPALTQDVSGYFRGNACFLAANAACVPLGVSAGNCVNARYVPPDYGAGGDQIRLSLFWPYKSREFSRSGISVGSEDLEIVDVTAIGGSTWTGVTRMRIAEQNPSAPSITTQTLMALGEIEGMEGACSVSFRFVGQPTPVSEIVAPAMIDEEGHGDTISNSGSSYLKTLD